MALTPPSPWGAAPDCSRNASRLLCTSSDDDDTCCVRSALALRSRSLLLKPPDSCRHSPKSWHARSRWVPAQVAVTRVLCCKQPQIVNGQRDPVCASPGIYACAARRSHQAGNLLCWKPLSRSSPFPKPEQTNQLACCTPQTRCADSCEACWPHCGQQHVSTPDLDLLKFNLSLRGLWSLANRIDSFIIAFANRITRRHACSTCGAWISLESWKAGATARDISDCRRRLRRPA